MLSLLLIHAAATLFMFGVIAVIQIVHYPLFSLVGNGGFTLYQQSHMRLITIVVVPPMLIELLTAVLLVWWAPPEVTGWQVGIGLVLVALIWASTALVQAPVHQQLTGGFRERLHQRLVQTNWLRTIAWAARSVLVLAMLYAVGR